MNTESATYESTPTPTKGSPGELHNKIQATRSRLDDTLDLLIEQLSPSQLIDSVSAKLGFGEHSLDKAKAKDTCRRACRTLAHQVRAHPGPTLLLGTGLVWMMLDNDEEPFTAKSESRPPILPSAKHRRENGPIVADESYIGSHPRDRSALEGGSGGSFANELSSAARKAKEAGTAGVESIKETARATAESTSEWTTIAADRGKHAGHQLAGKLKDSYEAGSRRYDEAMENHPLAVAAGALAAGLLAALALPRSRREDQLLGEQSDEVIGRVKQRGQEAADSAKIIAQRAGRRAADEAREAGISADNAEKKGKELAGKAGEVIDNVKQEVQQAAHEEKEKHRDSLQNHSSHGERKSH